MKSPPPLRAGRSSAPSLLESDHAGEPLHAGEAARIWQTSGLDGLEMLHGRYRTFSFARHFHETIAFGVVETGIMRTYCNGRIHNVPAGSVILLNPGDVHAPQPAVSEGWSFRMFYLNGASLTSLAGHEPPRGFAKPFVEDRALFLRLLRIHRHFEHDPDVLAAESLLASGLASISRRTPEGGYPRLRDPGAAKIERAREYLLAYCTECLSIRHLSAVTELSPYHLVRSFRARVGLTPHAFLTQARIERSRMLLSAGASIAETALRTGFADQSHFTRQFKRFTGVTPSRYLSRRT